MSNTSTARAAFLIGKLDGMLFGEPTKVVVLTKLTLDLLREVKEACGNNRDNLNNLSLDIYGDYRLEFFDAIADMQLEGELKIFYRYDNATETVGGILDILHLYILDFNSLHWPSKIDWDEVLHVTLSSDVDKGITLTSKSGKKRSGNSIPLNWE